MSPTNGRLDPKSRRPLPDGIRYRADRNKYQVRLWAVGLGGELKERSFLVGSLSEAKRLRAEAQMNVRPDGAMTLNAWHVRYWPTIDAGVRPATARAYDVAWRKRVKPWLGHRKLESITVGDIEQAVNGWEGSASTRNDALSTLSRLLDGAARAQVIAANSARLVRRPRDERAESVRSRALRMSEVRIMLDSVEAGPYRSYLAALVYTGMRAGEASALRVEDIDVLARVIHVRRNFSAGRSGVMVEQSPKSYQERTVPLPQAFLPCVEAAIRGKRRSELAFSGPRGGALNPSNVRRAVDWGDVRRKLDRPDLRIHDLRHTLATLLFDAGAAANDVQAILGHSSLQVTERYSRARTDVAHRANTALNSLKWTEGS